MGYASPFIRVFANTSRYAASRAKTHCRFCGNPCTWFTTQANSRPVLIDGHDPVPHRTERDDDGHPIEVHDREHLHLHTCEHRASAPRSDRSDALPSARARRNDSRRWRNES